MDKSFFENLFSKVQNPARVKVQLYDDKYYMIISSENTNDTMDCDAVYSKVVEDALRKNGMNWCYMFETFPQQSPCIYMFFCKDLSMEILKEDLQEIQEELPKGSNIYMDCESYSNIDVAQYDDSITVLEEVLIKHASEVFRVYEP